MKITVNRAIPLEHPKLRDLPDGLYVHKPGYNFLYLKVGLKVYEVKEQEIREFPVEAFSSEYVPVISIIVEGSL